MGISKFSIVRQVLAIVLVIGLFKSRVRVEIGHGKVLVILTTTGTRLGRLSVVSTLNILPRLRHIRQRGIG